MPRGADLGDLVKAVKNVHSLMRQSDQAMTTIRWCH
jgi:hypothetical protein